MRERARSAALLSPRSRTLAAVAFVGVVAFAVYLPALRNGFVWDDNVILAKQLEAFDDAGDLFLPPHDIPQYSPFYYRPMVILTYLIDRAVGGEAPPVFHLTPIVFHAAASAFLALLLTQLLGPARLAVATVGALFFAVHPVHVEVVAWMAGRGDALATLGFLLATVAWLRWLATAEVAWGIVGAVAVLVGLFSKEAAIASLPVLATLPWVAAPNASDASRSPGDRKRLLLWTLLAVCTAVYLALRTMALGTQLGVDRVSGATVAEILGTLGYYVELLVWPRHAGVVRTIAPSDTKHVLFGLAGAGAVAASIAYAIRRRSVLVGWGTLWVVCGLAPAFALIFRHLAETPVADRYAYMASAGVSLLLASALAALPARWTRATLFTAAVILVTMGISTARRATLWRDDVTFWSNSVAARPEEGFALLKLASALAKRGDTKQAESTYGAALSARLSPQQRAVVENNLGWLLLRQSRLAEAEPLFRRAVAAGPAFTGPYRGLVRCLWPRGADRRVREEIHGLLQTTLRLDPRNTRASLMLGYVRLADGDRDDAVRWFDRAARMDPQSPNAQRARAALEALRGERRSRGAVPNGTPR